MNIQEGAQNKSLSLIGNYSVASLPPLDDGEECHTHNEIGFPSNSSDDDFASLCSSSACKISRSFAFLLCSFGFVGNGIVIWLLGFRVKRNPFRTFILNLAVADFGVLLYIVIESTVYMIYLFSDRNVVLDSYSLQAWPLFIYIFLFMLLTGQFLLTAISIDRCVSVLFPIWNRCYRPTYLSATVCSLLWVTSFLICLIPCMLILTPVLLTMLIVTPLLCLPLMIISSLILFIKICFKSPKHKRGKALTAIFLTLLFFLIFVFPLTASVFVFTFIVPHVLYHNVVHYTFLGASLNSSVNPLIYFLVRRKKAGQRREKMKENPSKAFKEEEGHGPEMDSPV